MKTQIILEAFNSLNRTNITGVSTTALNASTSAGTCAGTPDPGLCLVTIPANRTQFQTPTSTAVGSNPGQRIVQLSAKIIF